MRRFIILAAVVALALAACAGDETATTSPPSSVATTTPATTIPVSTSAGQAAAPVAAAAPLFEAGDIDPGLQPFIDIAVADLAERLGTANDDIEVRSAVLVVWSDAGLGCPEPDMSYAQVPVDGAVIELTDSASLYRYHAGGTEEPFLCERPLAEKPATTDAPGSGFDVELIPEPAKEAPTESPNPPDE